MFRFNKETSLRVCKIVKKEHKADIVRLLNYF